MRIPILAFGRERERVVRLIHIEKKKEERTETVVIIMSWSI